jgi:hypothetical protein
MKVAMRVDRFVMSAAALAVLTLLPPAPPTEAAAVPSKTAVLACQPGWRGTAVGQYGGVAFEVSCRNGRGHERLTGMTGTAYSIRVGVEGSVAADCFYSGDAEAISESCAEVTLSIR